MKKIMTCCLLITVSLLLISCGKEVNSTKQTQNGNVSTRTSQQVKSVNVSSSGNFGVYDMTGEFLDELNNNPIDRDYEVESKKLSESSDLSTSAEINLESKYIKIWDTELNAIYDKLLEKLSSNEKEVLIKSQKGWLQNHTKESEFVNQVFYLRESAPLLGSQGRVQMQQAIKGRLRERTLELMEYYYLLGHNIEFIYK